MSQITIRRAGPKDAAILLELIRALAEYEHLPPPDVETGARLIEHAFGPRPQFEAYLAEMEGATAGYAVVFETYSTFLARPTLYVEDLFVRPEARRQGAAAPPGRRGGRTRLRAYGVDRARLERAGAGRLPPRGRRAARRVAPLPADW